MHFLCSIFVDAARSWVVCSVVVFNVIMLIKVSAKKSVYLSVSGSRDRHETDRYRDGPRRDERYDGGRDRYRDRHDDRDRRDYERGKTAAPRLRFKDR